MNIKVSSKRQLISLLAFISCAVSPVLSQKQNSNSFQRPLAPADLSRLEQIGDRNVPFSISPDGKYLAFVVVRAKSTAAQLNQHTVFDEERSDIWLAPVSGGKPRNITNGATNGSGYFMPSWSPDGSRLAMISTKGGGFRLWVWEKASEQKRLLTKRNVNYLFANEASIVWISNDQLVCSVLPEGKRPGGIEQRRLSAETATREWPKAWSGKERTASVIESGVPVKVANRPQGQLLLLDAVTGQNKVIAVGTFRALKLSPDRLHIAFLKQTSVFRPDPDRSLASRSFRRFASLGYQVLIATTRSGVVSPVSDRIDNVYTIAWSRDGSKLAIIGEQPGDPDLGLKTFIYDLAKRSVHRVLENSADPPNLMWSANHQLFVRAEQQVSKRNAEVNRSDWWLTDENEPPRNITARMPSVPAVIVEGPLGTIVGVANGDLWQISSDGAPPKTISVGLDGQLGSIVWPNRSAQQQGILSRLVVETRNRSSTSYYLIDLGSKSKRELPKPNEAARFVDFNSQSEAAVMTADTRNGSYLWLSEPNNSKTTLIRETNTFLRDITEGERRQIEYRSLDGRPLKGWLIFPVNYKDGKQYPLVTWVYPGTIQGDHPPNLTSLNYPLALNLQLLSGHGYAVLLPSIPLKPSGQVTETYLELANGTLPAVDKVIEMGIADPKRLAVMGHSWGGYATFSLITQTNKFRAAIGLAGLTNYASFYGEFLLNKRYTDTPLEFPRSMYDIEGTSSINLRLGKPPWKDMGLYLRNSPLSYVERVETPLMIIHGDMDTAVPIEQAEQFFSALYRQNKRARFVRYWGEGHVLDSPANILDMWQQIFSWFDEFLKKPEEKNPASEQKPK